LLFAGEVAVRDLAESTKYTLRSVAPAIQGAGCRAVFCRLASPATVNNCMHNIYKSASVVAFVA